jgi:[acyl-carrier-protein] S-malonyltransferase
MEPARHVLSRRLESVVLKRPQFPVVANINGEIYPFPEGWKEFMIDPIVRPVLWEDCVRRMLKAGADLFLEIGPGKVLTGLLRRIDRRARGVSISSLDDIRSLGGVLA